MSKKQYISLLAIVLMGAGYYATFIASDEEIDPTELDYGQEDMIDTPEDTSEAFAFDQAETDVALQAEEAQEEQAEVVDKQQNTLVDQQSSQNNEPETIMYKDADPTQPDQDNQTTATDEAQNNVTNDTQENDAAAPQQDVATANDPNQTSSDNTEVTLKTYPKIIKATYGSGENRIDITQALQQEADTTGKVHVPRDMNAFITELGQEDPAYGVTKTTEIEFQIDGEKLGKNGWEPFEGHKRSIEVQDGKEFTL